MIKFTLAIFFLHNLKVNLDCRFSISTNEPIWELVLLCIFVKTKRKCLLVVLRMDFMIARGDEKLLTDPTLEIKALETGKV